MSEIMTDYSIGNTLDIKSNDDPNPNYDSEQAKNLFKTLRGRKCIKVRASDFDNEATEFSKNIKVYKTKNAEASIEKDKYNYGPRNYHGRLGELAVQHILKVKVSNNEFGHSDKQDHADLIFRGRKLGVKTGTIRKYKGYFTGSSRTPVMYSTEKLPQIIVLVDEEVNCAYIIGIVFPKNIKTHLDPNLVNRQALVDKGKYGLDTFKENIVIPFENDDQLEEILKLEEELTSCQTNSDLQYVTH